MMDNNNNNDSSEINKDDKGVEEEEKEEEKKINKENDDKEEKKEEIKNWGKAVFWEVGTSALQGKRSYMEDRHTIIEDVDSFDDSKIFIEDEWHCNGCAYLNYASMNTCGNCYLPKPSTTSNKSSSSFDQQHVAVKEAPKEEEKKSVKMELDNNIDEKKTSSVPRQAYFAVFDGHGGQLASTFVAGNLHKMLFTSSFYPHRPQQALTESFYSVDQLYAKQYAVQGQQDGSTGCVILIIGQHLYCANVGDSRAVLCRDGNVIDLSHDHKPNKESEKVRIEACGGIVKKGSFFNIPMGPFRIYMADGLRGGLAVARGFGDIFYKDPKVARDKQLVIVVPEIVEHELCFGQDEYIVIASDGFWDVFSSEECVQLVSKMKNENKMSAQQVSKSLAEAAYKKDSLDNITVIVGYLKENNNKDNNDEGVDKEVKKEKKK